MAQALLPVRLLQPLVAARRSARPADPPSQGVLHCACEGISVNVLSHTLASPLFAVILTVVFGAIAMSGRVSMGASTLLLFVAWALSEFAVFRTAVFSDEVKSLSYPGLIVAFLILGYWITRHDTPKIEVDRFNVAQACFPAKPSVGWWWAMHLFLLNNSKSTQQHGEPANVTAKIDFYNNDGPKPRYLCHLYGRWADGSYPSPTTPKAEITPTTFPIGFTRELDICLKFPGDSDCYGINNESFEIGDLRLPQYQLAGRNILAQVTLHGPFVDKRFHLRFKNEGPGGGFSGLEWSAVRNWFKHSL